MARVLLVEDDQSVAVALRLALEHEGYEVFYANDGVMALEMAEAYEFDAIVLDVMLPGIDGYEFCKRLRDRDDDVPILMLTAMGNEAAKVRGLDLGADDYVTKPFSVPELLARIRALVRRASRSAAEGEQVEVGDLTIDFNKYRATREGEVVEFTSREMDLLHYLVRNRSRVITRERLLYAVWGMNTTISTRTVDVHIMKIRKKIGDAAEDPKIIATVHGLGYKYIG